MIHLRKRTCFAVLTLAVSAAGQSGDQSQLLARRDAEADCYRKLCATINGIEIRPGVFVHDFASECGAIKSEIDAFVKHVEVGPATFHDDGTCEVSASVPMSKIVAELRSVFQRHHKGGQILRSDFDKLGVRFGKDLLSIVGAGAPRAELHPELPQGIEDIIGAAVPTTRPYAYPDIWRPVSARDKLAAIRMARLDARRRLLERLMCVRINSSMLFGDLLAEEVSLADHADRLVLGAKESRRYFHHNELLVDVTVSIPVKQASNLMLKLYKRFYRGHRATVEDIEQVSKCFAGSMVEATGTGAPAVRVMSTASSLSGVDSPDWAGERIRAIGRSVDDAIGSRDGRVRAVRAATRDARERLFDRLGELPLTPTMSVKRYFASRRELKSQVRALVVDSVVEQRDFDDSSATVSLSVSGPAVWGALHAQMTIEARGTD